MVFCLYMAEPLSKTALEYCSFDHLQNIECILDKHDTTFILKNVLNTLNVNKCDRVSIILIYCVDNDSFL